VRTGVPRAAGEVGVAARGVGRSVGAGGGGLGAGVQAAISVAGATGPDRAGVGTAPTLAHPASSRTRRTRPIGGECRQGRAVTYCAGADRVGEVRPPSPDYRMRRRRRACNGPISFASSTGSPAVSCRRGRGAPCAAVTPWTRRPPAGAGAAGAAERPRPRARPRPGPPRGRSARRVRRRVLPDSPRPRCAPEPARSPSRAPRRSGSCRDPTSPLCPRPTGVCPAVAATWHRVAEWLATVVWRAPLPSLSVPAGAGKWRLLTWNPNSLRARHPSKPAIGTKWYFRRATS
jgi:hypothetical protein